MIDNNSKEFIYRHIGPTEDEQEKMLGCSYPNAPFLITLESQGY